MRGKNNRLHLEFQVNKAEIPVKWGILAYFLIFINQLVIVNRLN